MTDKVGFETDIDFPPWVVSAPEAANPLNRIAQVDLDDPMETELELEVLIRDSNVDQTLEYRLFLDADSPSDVPIANQQIEPTGMLDRQRSFVIAFGELGAAGVCHRIELVVSGRFAGVVGDLRAPEVEGDVFTATWWVEVFDTAHPVIDEACQ